MNKNNDLFKKSILYAHEIWFSILCWLVHVTCLMNIIHTCTNDYFESVSFSIGKFFCKKQFNFINAALHNWTEFRVCNLEITKILIPSIINYLVFPKCEAYTCIHHNFSCKIFRLKIFLIQLFLLTFDVFMNNRFFL